MLYAGTGRVDMTPPIGIALAGHWAPRPAQSIETPLNAHSVVLASDSTKLAIVSLDLIAILATEADEAKRSIKEKTGIETENILISCSHTHEAPYPCGLLGKNTRAERWYLEKVVEAIAGSVVEASSRLEPVEVGFGWVQLHGLCQNRRRLKSPNDAYNLWQLSKEEHNKYPPAGPVDEELIALFVRSGETIGVVWNFALHAHAFSCDRISADYPYYVWKEMERRLGSEVVSVYLPGACGDINRQAEPQKIVSELTDGLSAIHKAINFTSEAPLRARLKRIEFPLRDFSTFQEEEIRRKQARSLEICREEWELLREMNQSSITTVVQAMRIGELGMGCVPGEYFCALGLDIKKRSPFRKTMVAELSNDYIGYIPTAEAFEQGGYELFNARSSKVARGTGERIASEVVSLLRQIAFD